MSIMEPDPSTRDRDIGQIHCALGACARNAVISGLLRCRTGPNELSTDQVIRLSRILGRRSVNGTYRGNRRQTLWNGEWRCVPVEQGWERLQGIIQYSERLGGRSGRGALWDNPTGGGK